MPEIALPRHTAAHSGANAPSAEAAPHLPAVRGIHLIREGLPLLAEIDLTLRAERTIILGPNGAGKSLLLRLIQGLIAPDLGEVLPGLPTALVAQRPVLLRRSVQGNLAHALAIHGVPRRARKEAVAELLELGGLSALADRPARRLSGGEQQRLALLRALTGQPAALLLDEPSAHLDPHATGAIERLIAEAGLPFALVTHDIGQARRMADRVIFLHRGRIVEDQPSAQFFPEPASPEARAFLRGDLVL